MHISSTLYVQLDSMKMKLKIEVVSRETIKPSSPTPPHLRTFKLSFLDQLAPAVYVPLILFYIPAIDDDNNNKEPISSLSRCDHVLMKKCLSETLTRYYHVAGRMKDDSFSIVDCNDDGVEYVEARVLTENINIRLSDVIEHPDIHLLVEQFLPYEPLGFNYTKPLLAIQVNLFDCGGIVIGGHISHKIADASSFITFIKDWAAIARGGTNNTSHPLPELLLAPTLFPQLDLKGLGFVHFTGIRTEEIVTKRFVFGASKIAELKNRSAATNNINNAGSNNEVPECPTRVEALSAFIWRRVIDSFERSKDQKADGAAAAAAVSVGPVRVYGATHAVNMRTRMVPPLSATSFGNLSSISAALSNTVEGKKDSYTVLVGKVRDAIRKIDADHVQKLEATEGQVHYLKQLEYIFSSCTVILNFTSLCRLPSFEEDFGWGNPEWVSIATVPFKNAVVLMDTRSRDGIEAWVTMTKEDIAEFELDAELLAFVS